MPSSGDLPNPGPQPASLMLPALADSFFTPSATSDGVAMVLSDAAETRLSGEHIRTLLIGLHNVEQLLNNFH